MLHFVQPLSHLCRGGKQAQCSLDIDQTGVKTLEQLAKFPSEGFCVVEWLVLSFCFVGLLIWNRLPHVSVLPVDRCGMIF